MINTHIKSQARTIHVRRISAQTFWTLLVAEGILLALIFGWALSVLLPQRTPQSVGADLPQLQIAIANRLTGAVHDPLIELRPGVSAPESNLRGFSLHGLTYYYYVEGRPGFDPLSSGAVTADQIDVLLRDTTGPSPIVIYTLLP